MEKRGRHCDQNTAKDPGSAAPGSVATIQLLYRCVGRLFHSLAALAANQEPDTDYDHAQDYQVKHPPEDPGDESAQETTIEVVETVDVPTVDANVGAISVKFNSRLAIDDHASGVIPVDDYGGGVFAAFLNGYLRQVHVNCDELAIITVNFQPLCSR